MSASNGEFRSVTSHSVTVSVSISITDAGKVIGKYKVQIPATIPTAMHHVSPTKYWNNALNLVRIASFPIPSDPVLTNLQ